MTAIFLSKRILLWDGGLRLAAAGNPRPAGTGNVKRSKQFIDKGQVYEPPSIGFGHGGMVEAVSYRFEGGKL
jgi:hypothetical protein